MVARSTLLFLSRREGLKDFATRFKKMLPHADGPHLVTGRHFLQEDSGPEIAAHIKRFLKQKVSQ